MCLHFSRSKFDPSARAESSEWLTRANGCARLRDADFRRGDATKVRRCVELRALCNAAPRTPPGPEGSNGTGITPCAAEYPKFLSSLFVLVPRIFMSSYQ